MNWEDIFSDALWRGEDKRTPVHTAAIVQGVLGGLMGIPLEGRDTEAFLPILAKTGRCFVAHNELGLLEDSLTVGVPFEVDLRIEAEESGRAGFLWGLNIYSVRGQRDSQA